MVDKVAVIEEEFSRLNKKLEMNHQSIINNYEALTRKLDEVVSESGSLYAPEFSPKVQGLNEIINTDIIAMSEQLFTVTEEVIKNFEKAIVNMDTSNSE
ncbi:MAG TPA: hypothetical protein VK071_12340 [Tissierellales bacterium]|nr:hypothetical protein [Tissierellales bacterium]